MFVRVTRGRLYPARFDDLAGMMQDISAAVRAQPGCQSYVGALDRAAGKSLAVSTWDTAEHATFSRNEALASLVPRLQAIGLQLDPPEIYESSE